MVTSEEDSRCPRCNRAGKLIEVGTASGRGQYRCTNGACGVTWRAKNPAAVALGRLGGEARNRALSPERKQDIALAAGMANRRRTVETR